MNKTVALVAIMVSSPALIAAALLSTNESARRSDVADKLAELDRRASISPITTTQGHRNLAASGMAPAGSERNRRADDLLWRAIGEYEVTAYCPCEKCCGKWSDHMTADGTDTRTYTGRIVAAPKGIPYGTTLWVEGVGLVTVHDRGGAIKGKRLDLFFPTHQEALEFGRVKRKVWRS